MDGAFQWGDEFYFHIGEKRIAAVGICGKAERRIAALWERAMTGPAHESATCDSSDRVNPLSHKPPCLKTE